MGRPKDEHYWNQVTKEVNGMLKCKHCGHKFKGGVSRIKAHVDRKQGQGVRPCSIIEPGSVPDNHVVAGSSNPQGYVEAMNSFGVTGGAFDGGNYADFYANFAGSRSHLVNSFEGIEVPMDSSIRNCDALESEISDLRQSLHDLSHEEDDINGELQWLESRGKKRKRKVDGWLEEVGVLKKRAYEMIHSVDQGGSTDLSRMGIMTLTFELQRVKHAKPLVLSNEFVGRGFEYNVKEMWKLIGDDQVFIIGIHGMGGVGKTFLATHITDQIERKGTFNVFWVTVSQNFSIFKLQNDIAKQIEVKLDEDEERRRGKILSSALEKKGKSVLVLDDAWNYIDLQKVGIPLRVNGIKLILTSRLQHVCQQMDCPPNNIIRMKPLRQIYWHWQPLYEEEAWMHDDEAWELFLLKLGYRGTPATLPPEVEKIARSVAARCDGLPLGISVMARSMKGVNDISQWRHALNKLENSAIGEEMKEEVFKVLKLSYDNLKDKNIKDCFVRCGLYHKIKEKDLIMNLVDEGLINGIRSLEEILDEGHNILDKLQSQSLLSESGYLRGQGMHALMRDMVYHNILKERGGYMVKCVEGLTKMPHKREWTADLEKVSLARSNIQEIPMDTSPQCPRLSTLILRWNLLRHIPDCFFSRMNALAVLDLSYNEYLTCVPNSVSNLRSLISLLLKGCYSLEDMPPLGQLQKLSRLIITETLMERVPQGLETLTNLKWLDLSRNRKLTLVPGSVLPGLTNMQYLNLSYTEVKVKVEDVQAMHVLEYFVGSFHDSKNFSDYATKATENGWGLKTYLLNIGIADDNNNDDVEQLIEEHGRIVNFGDCEELAHLLPRDVVKLNIWNNEQWRCLCNALSFNGPSYLNGIAIECCPKLVFSHLRSLDVWRCHKIETLMTVGSLMQLQNLESIRVSDCESMKEIFAVRSGEDKNDDSATTITLPKLTKLMLWSLPQLKTLCKSSIITCGSSDLFSILQCPNLEKFPTVKVWNVS